MAIRFSFPLSDSLVPTAFLAWGRYDYDDVDIGQPAQVTLRVVGGAALPPFNINHRNDGVWTANVAGLVPGTLYTADASYTRRMPPPVPPAPPPPPQLVLAPQETGIEATNGPVPVPFPPPYVPPPPGPAPAPGGVALAAGVAPPVALVNGGAVASAVLCGHPDVIPLSGGYPACLKFQKAIAVVHEQARPRRYAYVMPVLTSYGTWTVLVPAPHNYPATAYTVQIVFLDRDGKVVAQTSVAL